MSSHGMFDGKEDDETQLINARKQESLVSVTVDWRELHKDAKKPAAKAAAPKAKKAAVKKPAATVKKATPKKAKKAAAKKTSVKKITTPKKSKKPAVAKKAVAKKSPKKVVAKKVAAKKSPKKAPKPVAKKSPAKATKKKAVARPKKVGPSVSDLIVRAVSASKERSRVSLPALKKVLAADGYDVEKTPASRSPSEACWKREPWSTTRATEHLGLSRSPRSRKCILVKMDM
ncbi:unnamed protein product [Arctogadus glacialis]